MFVSWIFPFRDQLFWDDYIRIYMFSISFRAGVSFVAAAPNDKELAKRVLFFDVMSEFAPKVLREDKARL